MGHPNFLVAALLGGGVEQSGIPGERDRDGAAVFQAGRRSDLQGRTHR